MNPPFESAAQLREAIRRGKFTGPTAGHAAGFVQTNLVILPQRYADDFARFCELNARACPLIAMTKPGVYRPRAAAAGADVRTDVPRYRVFRRGELQTTEPTDIRIFWRDDFVAFLLGCSFTFENALLKAGLPVRHIEEGRNVPMYRTSRPCTPAGSFTGDMVVSMRPFAGDQVEMVREITRHYPRMHGAPIHVGDPAEIGIADLSRPDFGQAVTVREDEVPVFWACGVTPQLALLNARCPVAITHSPGCMFVTDLQDEAYYVP